MKKNLTNKELKSKSFEGQNFLIILFTITYFVVGIIGINYHEMWRDEIQAWLVSANNSTIPDLFYNSRYEGHPILWHFILFLLNKIHLPIISMQIVHVLIATGTIYLIVKYSPFSWLEKIGLTLGNYLLYEYLVVSRAYGLGIFLLTLVVVLLNKPLKHLLFISITIFLLSNTSIWGLITAIGISGAILFHILPDLKSYLSNRKAIIKFTASILVILCGFILSIVKIHPPDDVSMMFDYVFRFDKERLHVAFKSFSESYFMQTSNIYLAILSILITVWGLKKHFFPLLFFLIPTLGILAFLYLTGKNDLRYLGILPMLLVMSTWIVHRDKRPGLITSLRKEFIPSDNLLIILVSIMIIFNAITGISRYKSDIERKFSNIEDVGKYLVKSRLNHYPLAGEIDYLATPFAAYSDNKPIFVIRRNEDCYYTIWDSKRTQNKENSFTTLSKKIEQYDNFEKMIIISHVPYIVKDRNNQQQFLTKGMVNKNLQIQLIKKFDEEPIRKYEKFYLYEITKIN